MKLPKLPDLQPVLDALRRKWLAALLVFALGIVLGVAVAVGKLGMTPSYEAVSTARIGTYAVAGVDLPCTPTTIPTLVTTATLARTPPLVKPPDVVTLSPLVPGAVPDPGFTLKADLAAPDVVRVHAIGRDASAVQNEANDRATGLATYCRSETVKSYKAYNFALAALKDQRQRELEGFDRALIPADAQKQQLADLTKKRDELQKQRDALNAQVIAQSVDASAKGAMQKAFEPVVVRDIQQSNSTVKTLQALVDADTVRLTTMKSQYRDGYPAVAALEKRVQVETQQLAAAQNEAQSKALPNTNPTYLAMSTGTAQARALADTTQQQLTAMDDRLRDLNAAVDKAKAVVDAAELRIASASRHKAEVLKAYQAMSVQFNTALAQETQIPASGPIGTLAAATGAVNLTARAAAILGVLVLLLFALLAVLTALALVALDRRLLTVAQITKLYGKPVISTLKPKAR